MNMLRYKQHFWWCLFCGQHPRGCFWDSYKTGPFHWYQVSLPTSNNQARRSLSPPSGHQSHYTTQANLTQPLLEKGPGKRVPKKGDKGGRGKIMSATATTSIPWSLVSRILLLRTVPSGRHWLLCNRWFFFFWSLIGKFISFQESVYKMSKMYGKVGREISLCSDWMEHRPVQSCEWLIAWSPTPGFSMKSRPKCLWHSESKVLANPSRERASNPPHLLSSLSSKLHRDIVWEK